MTGTVTLPDWVDVGAKFEWAGNLWQVRAIVDGGPVCRSWSGGSWRYERFEPVVFIEPTGVKQR
jgi:hypothetical protein